MTITTADERNLIFPLFAGLQQADGWDTFLRRLLPRTGATRICLLQRPIGSPPLHAFQREAWQGVKVSPRPLDVDALEACGLMPLQSLRPERVYSLDEMRAGVNDSTAAAQKTMMIREDVRHARFVRFRPSPDADAWLILVHDRKDFGAADSALLASVVPYLAVAIAALGQIMRLQLRAETAESALAMLGVGQAVLDRQGRPVVADAIAEAELDFANLRGTSASILADGCRAMARQPASARALVKIGAKQDRHALLRTAQQSGGQSLRVAAAIALVRRAAPANDASAARVATARFGLSAREAALAIALCRGRSLIEAGEALRLTRETARNYSKRIYAKTGASGQADLVRIILGDLVPFA